MPDETIQPDEIPVELEDEVLRDWWGDVDVTAVAPVRNEEEETGEH